MIGLLLTLVGLCAHGLAMKSKLDVLNELNATQFLDVARQLNDSRILGDDANGPYTILVPTNDAFAKLSQYELNNLANAPELLEEVVGVHVLRGELFSWDFRSGAVIVSANGHFIRVFNQDADTTYLNDAKVEMLDVEADGAVFILIDTVLDAPEGTIYEVLRKPDFGLSAFAGLVDQVHLNQTLHRGVGPFTVFAPSKDAFDRLSSVIKDELSRNIQLARHVAEYHIHSGTLHLKSLDRNGTLSTLYRGHNIQVLATVARFEEADIDCDNGVIHVIDHVLLPSTVGAVVG